MHRPSSVVLVAALAFAHTCVALGGDPVIDHCYVQLIDDIVVSAAEAGLLVELIDEQGRPLELLDGEPVQRGMRLAQLDDRQPKLERKAAAAELSASLARSQDDIEVRYSAAAYRVAQADYAAAVSANRSVGGTVPRSEQRRLELTQHRALLQIDRSKMEQSVSQLNSEVSQAGVESADAAIARRRVESPLDGIVLAVLKKPGEWVQVGEPVARVARMDRLRVEGFVSAADYNASEIAGRPVTVQFNLARGRKMSLPARVTFVSPLVQAGNRYRVRAEVSNAEESGQWLLRPGMATKMTIDVK